MGKFIQTTDLRAFNLLNRNYETAALSPQRYMLQTVLQKPIKKNPTTYEYAGPSFCNRPASPVQSCLKHHIQYINCSSTSLVTISINYRLDLPIRFSSDIPIHELMFVSLS